MEKDLNALSVSKVLNALSSDYEIVYTAHLETMRVNTVSVSPSLKAVMDTYYPNAADEEDLFSLIKYIGKNAVVPEETEMFYEKILGEDLKNRIRDGLTTSFEFAFNMGKGEIRHLHLKVVPYVEGDFHYMVVGVRDAEHEYEERRRLQENNEKNMNHIMKLSGNFEAIYDIDMATGEYMEFTKNNTYAENVSVKFVEKNNYFLDVVQNIGNVVYKEDRSMVIRFNSRNFMEKRLTEVPAYSYEYRLIINGQINWYRVRVVKDSDDVKTGHVLVGVFNVNDEVRERNFRQTQLENALSLAQAANKAKTTFLNNMSHDIRTPMNAIVGFAGLAEAHMDEKDRLQDYLKKINQSSAHLLSLINDVLDMSRIESGKMNLDEKAENLSDIMHEIITIFQTDLNNKHMEFNLETANLTHDTVICDKLRLKQVVINILSNAVKYTPAGGAISLKLSEKGTPKSGYSRYEIRVKDNGMGITPDFLKTIYEPFTRVKSSTISGIPGTGLGMAITKNIVEMMGGIIEIKSEIDVGTEVVLNFDFQLSDEKVPGPGENANAGKDGTGVPVMETPEAKFARRKEFFRGKKVLLVEDNELNLEIAAENLTEAGFIVDTACDGTIAVKKMEMADEGDYDLILMDIQMPIMDGYEATKRIRMMNRPFAREIPIIAMTANAFTEDRIAAIEAGMNEHMAKPINIAQLYEMLEKNLH